MRTDSTLEQREGGESYLQMTVILSWQQKQRDPYQLADSLVGKYVSARLHVPRCCHPDLLADSKHFC